MTSANAGQHFPTTDWSLLAAVREARLRAARAPADRLLSLYLPCIRGYLEQQWRFRADEVDDLVQGFIADRIIDGELLSSADHARGRFRSLLLSALQRYVIDRQRRRRVRQAGPLPADDEEHPATASRQGDPAEQFDRTWARSVLTEALARARRYCETHDRLDMWRVFELRLVAPAADGVRPVPYAEMVRLLGLQAPSQAAGLLVSAKRLFHRKLAEVLCEVLGSEADLESELRDLVRILSRRA